MATFEMQLNKLEETLLKIDNYLNSVDEKSKFKVMFIAEELLTNLVRHANFKDKTPSISFNIEFDKKGKLEIECRDNAEAFDFSEHKDPDIDAKLKDRELGGLGIYLVKKYAQELEYKRENNFNILRLSL